MTSISIPESVTSVGYGAFSGCTALKTFNFNAINCTDISSETIFDKVKLKSILFGDKVQYIPAYLCYGQTDLTSISIPATVTGIGDCAFYGCNALYEITVYATTPPSIAGQTFYNVDQTIPVYVPEGSVAAYKADPYWRKFNIQGADLDDPDDPDQPTSTDPLTTAPAFTITDHTITFPAETHVSIYTTSGTCVYTGTTTTVTLPASGIYIIVTPTTSTKIAL